MERIQALIDQLNQQKHQNASPAQLLLTVQLLQSELLKLQQRNGTFGNSKVAVTLPSGLNYKREEPAAPPAEPVAEKAPAPAHAEPAPSFPSYQPAPPARETVPAASAPAAIAEPEPTPIVTETAETQAANPYTLRKPVAHETPLREEHASYLPKPAAPQPVSKPATPEVAEPVSSRTDTDPAIPSRPFASPSAAPVVPVNTAVAPPVKEVHELIADKSESLNDRLKQEKVEVAHIIKDSPIKDLRRGIGINDRFAFVNELFRDDEAMYERSIKTINGFHVYSEAEYWINRELKVKLGWDDTKPTVQHFYQLVRRRFS
jgi:pyruvate/2-oxoglutarate dehydrogenase complex dihydrolipoamide acyltransferase (E2) component